MQTTKRTIGAAILALLFMTLAIAAHARVYKWVDENGRVHYTEQPPPQGEHTQLRTPTGSEMPQRSTGNTAVMTRSQQTSQERLNEVNARLKATRDLDAWKDQQRAEERRREDQAAAAKKAIDDAVVAGCKRNREVYCDKGAENIRQEEDMRRLEAESRASRAYGY